MINKEEIVSIKNAVNSQNYTPEPICTRQWHRHQTVWIINNINY